MLQRQSQQLEGYTLNEMTSLTLRLARKQPRQRQAMYGAPNVHQCTGSQTLHVVSLR